MGATTKIQWTDHTFNPWRGCQKIAAGCAHCYADAQAKRNPGVLGVFGPLPHGRRVVAAESMWREPIRWDRQSAEAGERHRVFCASMADVFEDWIGPMLDSKGVRLSRVEGGCEIFTTMDDIRRRLFALIDNTQNLDWLLLTKRPENIRRMWSQVNFTAAADCSLQSLRGNCWLGTSVATQADADRNIPELLKCRDLARVLFLSVEPLIESVDITTYGDAGIDWVIIGGESGSEARLCRVEWVASLVEQCRAADVPCFVKQLGTVVYADGKPMEFGDSKGGDPSEWWPELCVREFPR